VPWLERSMPMRLIVSVERTPIALLFCLGLAISPLLAMADGVVRQAATGFMPRQIELERGASLRITNDDPFVHHVYVDSPQLNFDSGEQRPGQSATIKFNASGTYVVQCAIHLKMRLSVTVR
jgi:plastocyanin